MFLYIFLYVCAFLFLSWELRISVHLTFFCFVSICLCLISCSSSSITLCFYVKVIGHVMQAHSKDASLVGRCCGVLFIYGLAYKTPDVALEAGCIHEIMNAMRKFEDDQLLQTSGCKALWNLTRTEDTVRVISKEMGGLKAILKAMKLHPESRILLENAMGSLWNPLRISEKVREEFIESGGIELVARGLLKYKDDTSIQSEGFAPLLFAANSESDEAKLAFLSSPSAIPALKQVLASIVSLLSPCLMKLILPSLLTSHLPLTHTQIFRDKPPWWDMAAMTWDLCMKHEQVSNVIGSFGLMEVNMLGDDEFDGDDEEDEWCTVQNAPFDVEGLLNKDLKGDDDVAGWFKAYPFHVDYQRALECDKKSDKTFLKPFVAPFVGQCICLRIMIPNGGRGYLYGD